MKPKTYHQKIVIREWYQWNGEPEILDLIPKGRIHETGDGEHKRKCVMFMGINHSQGQQIIHEGDYFSIVDLRDAYPDIEISFDIINQDTFKRFWVPLMNNAFD